jgi:hypothetical protein
MLALELELGARQTVAGMKLALASQYELFRMNYKCLGQVTVSVKLDT